MKKPKILEVDLPIMMLGTMKLPFEFTKSGICRINVYRRAELKLTYSVTMAKIAKLMSEQNKLHIAWNERLQAFHITT